MARTVPFPQCLTPGSDPADTPLARLLEAASRVAGAPVPPEDITLAPADAAALSTAIARHASRHTGVHVALLKAKWEAFYRGLRFPQVDPAASAGTMRVAR